MIAAFTDNASCIKTGALSTGQIRIGFVPL